MFKMSQANNKTANLVSCDNFSRIHPPLIEDSSPLEETINLKRAQKRTFVSILMIDFIGKVLVKLYDWSIGQWLQCICVSLDGTNAPLIAHVVYYCWPLAAIAMQRLNRCLPIDGINNTTLWIIIHRSYENHFVWRCYTVAFLNAIEAFLLLLSTFD